MSLSSDAPTTLARFTPAERWTHRILGLLLGVLIVTAALLFIPDLGGLVGNRQVVRVIHEVAGFAVPIPLVVAVFFRASARMRVASTDSGRRTGNGSARATAVPDASASGSSTPGRSSTPPSRSEPSS